MPVQSQRSASNSGHLEKFYLLDFSTFIYRQNGDGATTQYNTRRVIPIINDTTTVVFNEVIQQDTRLLMDDTRVVDMPSETEKPGTLIPLPIKQSKLTPTSFSFVRCRSLHD